MSDKRSDAAMATGEQDSEAVSGFDAPRTLGERILPVLVIAMEACLFYALLLGLAGFHFLGVSGPILPIWLLFSVPLSLYWYVQYLQRGKSRRFPLLSEHTPKILVILLACFSLWLLIYAPIFSVAWIQSLVSDALRLDGRFYQAVVIFALVCLLGWRGIFLARNGVESQTITRLGRLGLSGFLVFILLYLLQVNLGLVRPNSLTLLLLIPAFLFFLILARALHQVSYLRRFHAVGLQGSAKQQERLILQAVAILGVVAACLMTLVGSITLSGSVIGFFTPLGAAYDWLANILTQIVLAIWTPIVAFLTWLLNLFPTPIHKGKPSIGDRGIKACPKHPTPGQHIPLICQKPLQTHPDALLLIIKIALPVLLISLILCLLWRRYRKAVVEHARTTQGQGDIHESLWSWSLFLAQCKAILFALLARLHLLRRRAAATGQDAGEDIHLATPAARSIREIYRALLKKAARRGYARAKDETPYEFRQRLHNREPVVEPELETITEAYALIRYGGSVPNTTEVTHIRHVWQELDHKWEV